MGRTEAAEDLRADVDMGSRGSEGRGRLLFLDVPEQGRKRGCEAVLPLWELG